MSLLEVSGLSASYGHGDVLRDVDLSVDEGQIAVVLGANGAGKTTLLRALTGLVRRSGSIRFRGRETTGLTTEKIATLGVAHVPQGRGTFTGMTVLENLRIGARLQRKHEAAGIESAFEQFPRLAERRGQKAGSLSGGEQQMLAIARALMARPSLLLLDEPSLGLAPLVTQEVFSSLAEINRRDGTAVLVVEQNAHLALSIGSAAVVLESGRVVSRGSAEELQTNDAVRRAYLGG